MVNGFFGRTMFNLDVTADGRLLAGTNHCYFQGVLVFDDRDRAATPTCYGANDAPSLEGPPYPMRLSASDEVAVLQGRFSGSGAPDARRYAATNYLFEAQTVQRWTRHGQVVAESPLRSQLGVCAGSDSWWTRDVAVDGRDVFTVDPNLVQRRPDDRLPAWSRVPVVEANPESRRRSSPSRRTTGTSPPSTRHRDGLRDRPGEERSWSAGRSLQGEVNALPTDLAVHGDRATWPTSDAAVSSSAACWTGRRPG